MFFLVITAVLALFLIIISLVVFLSGPKEVSPTLVFNKPKINIDMKVFDSDQFKKLQPPVEMEIQYSYKAITADKKNQTGFISAVSEEKARAALTNMGLTVTDIKEIEIGRDNPFTPYFQTVSTSTPSQTTTPAKTPAKTTTKTTKTPKTTK